MPEYLFFNGEKASFEKMTNSLSSFTLSVEDFKLLEEDLKKSKDISNEFQNGNELVKIVHDGTNLYMIEYFENYKLKRYTRINVIETKNEFDNIDNIHFSDINVKVRSSMSLKLGLLKSEEENMYETKILSYAINKIENEYLYFENMNGKKYYVYNFKDAENSILF